MAAIAALDTAKTLFFSHYDPEMVKWLINYSTNKKMKRYVFKIFVL